LEISVLITLFNREQYIEPCIRSAFASDFESFEVIVLDDQSTDGSYEKVLSLQKEFPRLRVYRNDTNLGQFGNRNAIVALAKGKYVKFIDSDDLLYPHTLRTMYWCLSQHPEAGAGIQDPFSKSLKKYPVFLKPKELFHYNFFTSNVFLGGPSSSLIKREVFEEFGGYQTELLLEDNLFWVRVGEKYPLVLMPSCLVYWRQHGGQEFSKWGEVKHNIHYLYFGLFTLYKAQPFLTTKEYQQVQKQLNNWLLGKMVQSIKMMKLITGVQWFVHGVLKRANYKKKYGIIAR